MPTSRAEDLARRTGPIGGFLEEGPVAGPGTLSAEEIADFFERGFTHGHRVLSERQCDALLRDLERVRDPEDPGHVHLYEWHADEAEDPELELFHALGAWRLAPAFHDLLFVPGLVTRAAQLLGGPIRLLHDQVFAKPAGHGGRVSWHQDYSYWTWSAPMAHLSCWIGLDDADRDNGCLECVPGSHRWELQPRGSLSGSGEAEEELPPVRRKALDHAVPLEMPRGQASFHHPLTVHGSGANRSPRPRRALVLNFVADGVVSRMRGHDMGRFPRVPEGEPLGDPDYPLIFPRDAEEARRLEKLPRAATPPARHMSGEDSCPPGPGGRQ